MPIGLTIENSAGKAMRKLSIVPLKTHMGYQNREEFAPCDKPGFQLNADFLTAKSQA